MNKRVLGAYGFGRVVATLQERAPLMIGHNCLFDLGHLYKLMHGACTRPPRATDSAHAVHVVLAYPCCHRFNHPDALGRVPKRCKSTLFWSV